MDFYLVGGAVRDQLLNMHIRERDFVVVGESPESMIAKGFKQVGKDFPVFLHPDTHEEYALARKERKTATGYHGFEIEASATISLEEDLLRRDLTINAIAQDSTGKLIDPYGGQKDLKQKLFRHVSNAFVEDPLRVLRVARFQAYLPDFSIHPNTLELMRTICQTPGELSALPTERIWLEVNKAAQHQRFDLFWTTLSHCGALEAIGVHLDNGFTDTIKTSSLEGVMRLLSACWCQQDISGFLNLSPPANIADGIKIIAAQKETLLLDTLPAEEVVLATLKRLDPFRRLERALTIIQSMPDTPQKNTWHKLCIELNQLNITPLIQDVAPHERQGVIENARLKTIKDIVNAG
ncbi:MAG: hypothetical protein VXW87_03730 [Pseudomonadota bacterium]|nr:hypothetical protein [Pseudomonadota bacterium]